jgi:hypothetical protein
MHIKKLGTGPDIYTHKTYNLVSYVTPLNEQLVFLICLDKQRDEEARSEFDHATSAGRSTTVPIPIVPINVGSHKRALRREKI